MSSDATLDALNRAMSEIAAEHFPELIRRSASYKYYEDKKKNRYFYTVNRIHCNCKRKPKAGHYAAGKYSYKKGKNQYKLTRRVCFSKKRKAIEWAERECDKACEKQ